jgi:anaerobic magnesium-protoporphyrin IX monomethyl ester cyclase
MRISIVVPTQLYKYKYPAPLSMSDFPVGLAYIAGALKAAGHEVFGCNPNNLYDFPSAKAMAVDTITRHLDQYKPEVVCTGGICTDYAFLRDCTQTVRKRQPSTPIVLGGGIVSYDPRFVFEYLKPDFAVKGDGEHIVTQIVSSISSGTEPKQIPNIFYRKDGKTQATPEDFCYPDIETLIYPEFDIFDANNMLDNFSLGARPLYRYPHAEPRPWMVVAGRGCPFRCTFCVHDRPTPYHTRSSADVMKELAYFHDKYRFNILVILDELFAPKRDRLVEFSHAIKKLRQERKWDLAWCFQTHANVGLTQEDIMTAKDAGCYAFSYGMESASETVLTSMKKKSHPKQIAEVIPMCYKAGVGFGGNFIFGDPAETPGTMKETMTFFREHCENLHMSLGSIQPYPGSTLYVNCLKDKTIPDAGQFYETIDERRYRMAPGFPEKPWAIWCGLMGFFGGKGLWHKAAPAVVRDREISAHFDTLVLDAKCPHCNSDFTYRHVEVVSRKKDVSLAAPQTRLLQAALQFKNHRLFTWLVLKAAWLISFRYPWFGHLKYTVRPKAQTDNSTVTGCPNCNQCVRVEWQPQRKRLAAAAWPQNTGNSLHFAVGKRAA